MTHSKKAYRADLPDDGRPPASIADEVLLAAFGRGNQDAFQVLFYRYRDPLVSLAHLLCGDFQVGEELVRRTMVSVFKTRKRRPKGVTLRLKLMRELVRRAYGFDRRSRFLGHFGLRHRVRTRRILPVRRLEAPARGPEHARREAVVQALARLPIQLRVVVSLCDLERLTYEEAGRVIRASSRKVGLRLGRGRFLFSAAFQRIARSMRE